VVADTYLLLLGRFGLLAGLAALFGLVLHVIRIPGGRPAACITGGVVAGLLVGPLVLGNVRPSLHRSMTQGDHPELRAELEQRQQAHRREIAVMLEAGVSREAVSERIDDQRLELDPAMDRLDRAIDSHRLAFRRALVVWLGLVVLAGSLCARRSARRDPTGNGSPLWIIAGSSVVLGGLVGAVLASWMLGIDRATAIAIGAATGAGSVFSRTPVRWIARAGRTRSAARFGGAGLFIAILTMALAIDRTASAWLLVPTAGVMLGAGMSSQWRIPLRVRTVARWTMLWPGMGGIAAACVAQINPADVLGAWTTAGYVGLSVVLAGVGHWAGAGAAARAFGHGTAHRVPTTWWLEAHARGVPMTQICFAGVLIAARIVNTHTPTGGAVVLGLVLAACASELALPLTRRALASI